LTIKTGLFTKNYKNSKGLLQDYFLFFLEEVRIMPAEITTPAIAAVGERGRP